MKKTRTRPFLLACAASLLISVCGVSTEGQEQNQGLTQPEKVEQTDDVIRISTDLVQVGVSVLDRDGRFVEGLKKEDFEMKVDGKLVEVGFFDRVAAGAVIEEAQLAAARGNSRAMGKSTPEHAIMAKPLDLGRAICFFVDDIHIAPDSLKRAKDTIRKFIDREMGQNDLVAIASPSGQIGFLQQYTDNKEVLKMAVARLSYRNFGTRDLDLPVMTQNYAILVDRGDQAVLAYLAGETVRMQHITMPQAVETVKQRARVLLNQSARLSKITLSTLETLAHRSAGLPGRKLIFFISDGFPLDTRNSATPARIRSIADASIRSGTVIYSIDSRGLATDMMDATIEVPFDPTGRMTRAIREKRLGGEDVLNALAADTGGRFIRNTNDFGPYLTKALEETSAYYLLAWRPDDHGGAKKFRRIEVSVNKRPELSVLVQRGYFETLPAEPGKQPASAKAPPPPADPLRQAINSLFPKRELPTRLALSYMETPAEGSVLVSSMKIDADSLRFEQQGDKTAAVIDIVGTVFDASGKALDSFRHRLTVTPPSSESGAKTPDIIYNHRAKLKPGLYQVRVAALDRTSRQTGSVAEWVVIPDLLKQGLSMSSLMVGERKPNIKEEEINPDVLVEGVPVSVDHRFERSSNLRFLVYIYNAARAAAAENAQPDVALQVQIYRDGQPVIVMPLRKVATESQDPRHLAYAAEIPLQEMRSGQYVLQVTAIDRIAKASASQRVRFEVQ